MKKLTAALVLVAVSLLPSHAYAQTTHDHAADSPKVSITAPAQLVVGATILPAGDYKFQCRRLNGKAYLIVTAAKSGKEVARVACVSEMLDSKIRDSQLLAIAQPDGTRLLKSVRIKGETVAHRVLE